MTTLCDICLKDDTPSLRVQVQDDYIDYCRIQEPLGELEGIYRRMISDEGQHFNYRCRVKELYGKIVKPGQTRWT